jgi:hypothetical protein
MNRIMLVVAVVIAGLHLCASSGARAQDSSAPPTNIVAGSVDGVFAEERGDVGNHMCDFVYQGSTTV